jgi:hypothetical protein
MLTITYCTLTSPFNISFSKYIIDCCLLYRVPFVEQGSRFRSLLVVIFYTFLFKSVPLHIRMIMTRKKWVWENTFSNEVHEYYMNSNKQFLWCIIKITSHVISCVLCMRKYVCMILMRLNIQDILHWSTHPKDPKFTYYGCNISY